MICEEKYYRFIKDPRTTLGMTADIRWYDTIQGHQQNQIVFGRVVGRKTKDGNQDWAMERDELVETTRRGRVLPLPPKKKKKMGK